MVTSGDGEASKNTPGDGEAFPAVSIAAARRSGAVQDPAYKASRTTFLPFRAELTGRRGSDPAAFAGIGCPPPHVVVGSVQRCGDPRSVIWVPTLARHDRSWCPGSLICTTIQAIWGQLVSDATRSGASRRILRAIWWVDPLTDARSLSTLESLRRTPRPLWCLSANADGGDRAGPPAES